MRTAFVLLGLVSCGGSADPGTGARDSGASQAGPLAPLEAPPEPQAGSNLLLVTLDTVRADHLGCYGYFRNTTPNLDELARDSVLFERCVAPMATTLPSHTSMFTGVWPAQHGVLANIKRMAIFERDEKLITLTEVLKAAGYETAAFVSAFPLRSSARLSAGFDVYGEPEGEVRELSAETTTDAALAWLEGRGDAPYFLWVHYFDPHNPYEDHPETGAFETSDDLREWLAERAVTLRAHREKIKRGREGETLDAIEVANQYDSELRYVDHHVGRIFDAMQEKGRWDQTIVAVIGDHGEGLNQHETPGHGYVWFEQLHVPCLIRVPGMSPGRSDHMVSVVDLPATLLARMDIAGAEQLTRQQAGVDLLDPAYSPRSIIATTSARRELTDNLDESTLMTDRWKFVRHGTGGASLYDLDVDPYELRDVSVLYPDLCEDFAKELGGTLASQRSKGGGFTRDATPEEIEALEALGYAGGAGDGLGRPNREKDGDGEDGGEEE